MSFQIEPEEKSFAGSDLILQVVREMRHAFAQEKTRAGSTQQSIANRLGLRHRSVVNKWLSGKENLGLRTIGEFAWALNKRAIITFVDCNDEGGNFFEESRKEKAEIGNGSTRMDSTVEAWRGVKAKVTSGELTLENA